MRNRAVQRTIAAAVLIIVAVTVALVATDRGHHTVHSASRTRAVTAATFVSGVPASTAVVGVAVNGSTGWVLDASRNGGGIWRVTPTTPAKKVIEPGALADLDGGSVAISAWDDGVVVRGQRCVRTGGSIECSTSTGVVELFGHDGTHIATVMLWRDKPANAGGMAPKLIGVDDTHMWLAGQDAIYEIDRAGDILATMPSDFATTACPIHGTLYAVRGNVHGNATSSTGASGASGKSLPPELTDADSWVERWDGKAWSRVKGSASQVGSTDPDVACSPDGMDMWGDTGLIARWQPAKRGWATVDGSPLPLSRRQYVMAGNGVSYRLTVTGVLERLDPTTGTFAPVGLTFSGATQVAAAPASLEVDERGGSIFACAGKLTGATGMPTSPATACGFVPTRS